MGIQVVPREIKALGTEEGQGDGRQPEAEPYGLCPK